MSLVVLLTCLDFLGDCLSRAASFIKQGFYLVVVWETFSNILSQEVAHKGYSEKATWKDILQSLRIFWSDVPEIDLGSWYGID